jgi:hypothetical protein
MARRCSFWEGACVSWYELLLTLHILAAALWFGSGIAITVFSLRLLAVEPGAFGAFSAASGWWAARAHPAAALVILLAGIGMVIDADLSFGELWIVLALIGWLALSAVGGALINPAGKRLTEAYERSGGVLTDDVRPHASRLLTVIRIETVVLILVITDMVVKPT